MYVFGARQKCQLDGCQQRKKGCRVEYGERPGECFIDGQVNVRETWKRGNSLSIFTSFHSSAFVRVSDDSDTTEELVKLSD